MKEGSTAYHQLEIHLSRNGNVESRPLLSSTSSYSYNQYA